MHWNNEAPPLEYEIITPADVRVIPAAAAFSVVEEPADADPREFLVDIRADDRSEPRDLRVTYYACDDANTFCVPVTQQYAVHLEVDAGAGRVSGERWAGGAEAAAGPAAGGSILPGFSNALTLMATAASLETRCPVPCKGWSIVSTPTTTT